MKKLILLSVAFVFAASNAFAADQLTIGTFADAGKVLHGHDDTAADTTAMIGKLSTGVALAMQVDGTNGAGYSLATQHKSGTKIYASSYDSTAIYNNDATVGTAGVTLSNTDTSDFSDWDKL